MCERGFNYSVWHQWHHQLLLVYFCGDWPIYRGIFGTDIQPDQHCYRRLLDISAYAINMCSRSRTKWDRLRVSWGLINLVVVGGRGSQIYSIVQLKWQNNKSGALNLKVSFNIISKTNFQLFVRSIYHIHLIQLHPVAWLVLWASTVASYQREGALQWLRWWGSQGSEARVTG